MTAQPFVDAARAITMQRDLNRLREAIRNFDPDASDKALDKCERWFGLIGPNPKETQE